ncbi:MAG TPA: response regulator [Blastocatellia bacterium]
MILDILLVEDSLLQLEDIAQAIEGLNEEQRANTGIGGVCITKANCGAVARYFLAQAVLNEKPYDLLILDLSLPEHPGGDDNPELGFELLDTAREQKAVKGIVVVSAFDELSRFVAPAFQRGATEFIAKPYSREELQQRVLRAWDLIRERHRQYIEEQRTKEGAVILDGLIKELAPYAEEGLAYRFSSCFSRFIQSVVYETDELREELQTLLSPDLLSEENHPLAQRVRALNETVEEAQQNWDKLQEAFKYDENEAVSLELEEELRQIGQKLRPCVEMQFTAQPDTATRVLSFQQNVRITLRELLIGGLSAVDTRRIWQVNVSIDRKNGFAAVYIEDDFPTLDAATMALLNKGEAISPDRQRWRAWGLSVAQHLALRGGGRIEIQPRTEAEGNIITYLIPLAQHA